MWPEYTYEGDFADHMTVVIPQACRTGPIVGRGSVGSWIGNGGTSVVVASPYGAGTPIHEIGHNFGLNHAGTPSEEYGDWY